MTSYIVCELYDCSQYIKQNISYIASAEAVPIDNIYSLDSFSISIPYTFGVILFPAEIPYNDISTTR